MTISKTTPRYSALLLAAFLSCLLVLGTHWTPANADETTAVAPGTADTIDAAAVGEVPATDASDGDCPYKGKGPCCVGCREQAKTSSTEGTSTGEAAASAEGGCPCQQRARRLRQGS